MNTDYFIKNFVAQHQQDRELSKLDKMVDAIYKHPTVVKTIEMAGILFGLGCLVSLPISFPAMGGMKAVLLTICGGVVGTISGFAYRALDIVVPPHHSMSNHVFKAATYGVGKLYYQGDVPILELNSDDPYQAGQAHGFLMGEALDHVLKQFDFIKSFASLLPHPDQATETLKAIRQTLPQEYIDEMQGIVDGFNQWSKENKWFGGRVVTLDDLLLFHLMPDSLHFTPQQIEERLRGQGGRLGMPPFAPRGNPLPVLGCTVVIDEDKKEGLTFGRNMDWPTFGVFGTYSLIINRKYTSKKLSTVEVGFPGFVGTLTGMNPRGLSLSMNVCSGKTFDIKGMPAAFFNRLCLETCHSVKEVAEKIEKEAPLGRYHLSVADATAAQSFHLFQGSDKDPHVVRKWQPGQPLITTNCNYPAENKRSLHMHCSREREQIIQDLFLKAKEALSPQELSISKLVQASLSLPYVNNIITSHRVVMNPRLRKIQVAFDNAFAGQADLHELDVQPLFG